MTDDCLCGHTRAQHTVDGCTGYAGAETNHTSCTCTEFRSPETTPPPLEPEAER